MDIALLALALPGLAMPPAQASACNTLLTLRGWQAPLRLAGDVPEPQAVALLRDHLRWQRTAITATQLAPDVDELRQALWDAVRDYNLSGLYRTLPDAQADWRSLTVAGRLADAAYDVRRTPPDAFDTALSAFAQTASQLAMRPRPVPAGGPPGDRYELRARLRANVGPIAWADVLDAGWMGLDRLTTTAAWPTPRSGGFLAGTGSDAEILLQLQPAFAHFFDWYLGIAAIPDILAADSTRSPAQHMQLIAQVDDGLRAHYPQVADYLDQIKGFISVTVTIQNEAGRWLQVDLDSVKQRMRVDGWVYKGHLVPTRDGTPRLDAVDTATSLDALTYQSVLDVRVKALGVKVRLKQWPIDWTYRRTDDGATYNGRIRQQPRIEIGGAALGFIPTGVVDVVIPNNIEGIAHDFMQVLTQSNDGAGAALDVAFREHPGSGSELAVSADGDTLDNFFVKFAVSLVNKRIIPNAPQFDGLKRLASDAITALLADTQTLAAAQQTTRHTGMPALEAKCRNTQAPSP